jgi:hypothetical protein
VAVGV